jgi:hypothetical protein
VIPRTKYRWSAKKTRSGSAIEMNAAAPRRCQPLPREFTRLAMTTVSGRFSGFDAPR